MMFSGADPTTRRNRIFDYLAIAFICLHAILLFLNWNNYPTELDSPYHLLMGKMFFEKGGIAVWDSYEFAPEGRPQLYPPLLHVIIWFFRFLTGASFMDVGRMIVVLQNVLGLFFIWSVLKKFFGSAAALFGLVFFTSGTENWWWQTSVTPAALIIFLYLPFLSTFYRKKIIFSILILTASLYLNYGLSFVLVVTAVIAILFKRDYFKSYAKILSVIVLSSLALFAPWIWRIFNFRYYFFNHGNFIRRIPLVSFHFSWWEVLFNLHILLWIFAVPGIVYCFKKRRDDLKYALFLSGLFSFLFFLFVFLGLRFNAHSTIIASVFSGITAALLLERIEGIKDVFFKKIAMLFFVLLLIFTVFFEYHYLTPTLFRLNRNHLVISGLRVEDLSLRQSPFLNEIISASTNRPLSGKHKVKIQDFFADKQTFLLLEYLKNNTEKSAVIHILNEALSDYITLETGRVTDNGMYWEVFSPEMLENMIQSRRRGIFVSTRSDYSDLFLIDPGLKDLPPPKTIKKIGQYYIGYR